MYAHCYGKTGQAFSDAVDEYVEKHRHTWVDLKSNAKWQICTYMDVIYDDDDLTLRGWNKFYLDGNATNMRVIGIAKRLIKKVWMHENISLNNDDAVLMVCCNDRKVYMYDGKALHMIASSLRQLHYKGIEYPSTKSYSFGYPLRNATEKNWDKLCAKHNGKLKEVCLKLKHILSSNVQELNIHKLRTLCGYPSPR
ncbi:US22 protein [European chub iridovirus]|nr:US22 protein [European chub iridovirus]